MLTLSTTQPLHITVAGREKMRLRQVHLPQGTNGGRLKALIESVRRRVRRAQLSRKLKPSPDSVNLHSRAASCWTRSPRLRRREASKVGG